MDRQVRVRTGGWGVLVGDMRNPGVGEGPKVVVKEE